MIQTSKDYLHHLVDELPEGELLAARRFLEFLRTDSDPAADALDNVPWDEATEDEREAIEEARAEIGSSPAISSEELRRRFGPV